MPSHHGALLSKVKNGEVIFCETCNFAHVIPIPNDDDLLKMYEREFYQAIKPDSLTKYEAESEYWDSTFDDRLALIEQHVPPGRILDIGCGGGFFLMRAKSRGWKVLGVEPSSKAADYARQKGIDIIQDFFQNIHSSEMGKFDVIHMRFFLEHSSSPDRIMQLCNDLLEEGGMVVIEVPNDYNPLQKAVRQALDKHEYWVAIPDHINYFDLQGITNLLERHDLKIFYTESTFPLELFLLMGFDYVGNDAIGKEIHSRRMALELNLKRGGANRLKRTLYSLLSNLGIGREMIVYAKHT